MNYQWQDNSVMGIGGLMKSYQGYQAFSGCCDGYIDNFIILYDNLEVMCKVTEVEKVKSIPIIFKMDSLN